MKKNRLSCSSKYEKSAHRAIFLSIFNPWICKKLYDKHFHRSELYSKLLFFNPGKLFTQICVQLQVPGESKILQRA